MKKPFAVGDRVRVYCVNLAEQASRFKGTIISLAADTAIVRGDDYPDLKLSVVHVKQCRRLLRKPRKTYYAITHEKGYLVKAFNQKRNAERALFEGMGKKLVELVERKGKR